MQVHVRGAGCLGLSAALALAEAGHDVTIEDPQLGGATGKGAGIVSTMTWNDDDFHLVQRTRGRIGEIMAEAAMEGHAWRVWRSVDSIAVAAGDHLAHMDDVQHRLERLGEEPERLDAAAARAAYPGVVFEDGEEVLVAQEDGYVEPGDLAEMLRWAGQEAGVRTEPAPSGVEATVVAAGAWTSKLLPQLPIAAFRAQAASIGLAADVPIVHDTVHGFYVRPESDATVLVGDGTRLWPHDPDDYDEASDTGFRDDVARGLVLRLADAGQAVWRRGWAGLCVGTPDRRPLCGRVPGTDTFVLTGDNGFGIMRCIALGERLARAVDGDEHAATSPARFEGFEGDWRLQEGFAW